MVTLGGFWALIATAFNLYKASMFWPTGVLQLAPILLIVGGVTPGLTFVALERRSARAG